MEECIFCKIINEEIPSKTIYEDQIVKVIMNINPEANGDLLILTKEHIKDYRELNDSTITTLYNTIKKMDQYLKDKLGATGISIISNAGSAQEIRHFHVHLTPSYDNEQPIVDVDIIYDKLKELLTN